MEQFYRVAKVAEMLGQLSQSTVWLYTRQGKLKSTKLSPKVTVWRESDIRAFVQSQNDALNDPRVKTA
ncbi:MAG: helix-turn-helix domain-containing protein [Sulfuricurvum sp.]|nr:helix-turn-helix domain-containing protein [Sulfuricurvum sp.]